MLSFFTRCMGVPQLKNVGPPQINLATKYFSRCAGATKLRKKKSRSHSEIFRLICE